MIKLTRDRIGPPYERCCLCRKPTPWWYAPNDVAVCKTCGATRTVSDLPTKEEWFAAEQRKSALADGGDRE